MKDIINLLISDLKSYGLREVTLETSHPDVTILNWSNGSAGWYTHHSDWTENMKRGDVITLDANQLIVPFKRAKVLDIIDELDTLPLYKYSFEGRTRNKA